MSELKFKPGDIIICKDRDGISTWEPTFLQDVDRCPTFKILSVNSGVMWPYNFVATDGICSRRSNYKHWETGTGTIEEFFEIAPVDPTTLTNYITGPINRFDLILNNE